MIYTRLSLCLLALILSTGFDKTFNTPVTIEKYKIELPNNFIKAAGGFNPGIGSGLVFNKKTDIGLEFFGISDRGPNFPHMTEPNNIISFNPQYTPKIVKIALENKGSVAKVTEFIDLKLDNKPITGINPHQYPDEELIHNANLNRVTSTFGLDPESISILKNGDFVIGDEYYPSINIVDPATGNIKHRLTPGDGLPTIFKHRKFNKGFEAVTVAPNGKVYAMLEGVIAIDAHTKQYAKLIRMLEIDLNTLKIKTYAYPFDYDMYEKSSDARIGDIAAIDNENFLIIEQGRSKSDYRNVIYKINIKDATDISSLSLAPQKELEHLSLKELQSLNFITKTPVINLREHGWKDNKLEGLAIIDTKTIAITNDNDFALKGYKANPNACTTCQKLIPEFDESAQKTNLWVIYFSDSF